MAFELQHERMSFATSNRAADVKWTPMWGRVLLRCMSPDVCRLCAGCVQVFGRRQDVLSTRSCGRRPKSAKARNRGGWGTRRGRERYGDLGGSCVPVRFDCSGADYRFISKYCVSYFEP